MAKTTTSDQPTPTAVAEAEPATPPAQTKEEIAATEQALGLAPKPATNGAPPQKASVRMGVAPTNIEEGWRLAQFIASSELVPKNYRNRPSDVLVAIQYGMEVGLPPMAALHSIFVTNGRPSLWGDGFLAVIMASGVYADHDEYFMVDGVRKEFLLGPDLQKDDTTAVVTFWRKDSQRPRTATFSIAKAKRAGLWTKAGPWQEYPDRMLKLRARGFAGHDAFPDVLRGIRTAEEVIDLPPQEFEPAREVRRLSETPASVGPAVIPPSAPAPAAELLNHGPTAVKAVEAFLGGFTITLGDGTKVDTVEQLDAAELEKFIDTPNKVTLVVSRAADGNLQLVSFRIAD
jgi:hypothetical protein